VALVREQTIPTERPPPVGELVPTAVDRWCHVVGATDSNCCTLGFLDRACLYTLIITNVNQIRCRMRDLRIEREREREREMDICCHFILSVDDSCNRCSSFVSHIVSARRMLLASAVSDVIDTRVSPIKTRTTPS
jgi:hypothetical protein